jgi:phospholipid/cholesterol/gamma-HCH transport system permease protein
MGIAGGYVAGTLSGVISSADFISGIQDKFIPYNVIFALIKTVVFAYIITTVASYHGFYTEGGALEVGQSSTKGVVYSSILILVFDYILTQILLT